MDNQSRILTFGKFKGDYISEHINERDASYLLWADDNVKFFHLGNSDRAGCERLAGQVER